MTEFVTVCKVRDVPAGKGKAVDFNGKSVALFHVDGQWCAIGNVCPHQGGPLAEGSVAEGVVSCPWHGWRFDVKTGRNPDGMPMGVGCYQVRVQGEEVQIGS